MDYTQVGRENFKEIKAFGMSLKHQLFSMPGMPISMATKTAAITEMVKTIESVIAVKVFFKTVFGHKNFLPNPPNGLMGDMEALEIQNHASITCFFDLLGAI